MLYGGKQLLLLYLQFYLIVSVIGEDVETFEVADKTRKSNLVDQTLKLLNKFEHCVELNKHITFAALLSEFLIKQKVRFYEATRYEGQVYFQLLHKLNSVIQRADATKYEHVIKSILANVFQKNVLLLPTSVNQGQIDIHLEYKTLAENYLQLLEVGFPNASLSDQCLDDIVSLEYCAELRSDCLDIIVSDLPNYGYQRTHQVLLLYVLMHHTCSRRFGSKAAYDIMASERCSQVYREQNAIRKKTRTMRTQYKDLYLEQIVVCSLFGYAEFLNWHNLEMLLSWSNVDGCYCLAEELPYKSNCNCDNHLNSLALVYYVNALLLLE